MSQAVDFFVSLFITDKVDDRQDVIVKRYMRITKVPKEWIDHCKPHREDQYGKEVEVRVKGGGVVDRLVILRRITYRRTKMIVDILPCETKLPTCIPGHYKKVPFKDFMAKPHCGFSCSMSRDMNSDLKILRDYLKNMKRPKNRKMIAFSDTMSVDVIVRNDLIHMVVVRKARCAEKNIIYKSTFRKPLVDLRAMRHFSHSVSLHQSMVTFEDESGNEHSFNIDNYLT